MSHGASGAAADLSRPSKVRRSVIAGSWYPGDALQLRTMIAGFLEQVPSARLDGDLVGLVAPHAGYMYSGQVAAHAYAQLRGKGKALSRVVVVSPVHHMYSGAFAVTENEYYETPLGLVPVDTDLVEVVGRTVPLRRVPQDTEHSLEIQLPFLQFLLERVALTPIMMGDQDWESAQRLGHALAGAIGQDDVLLVASTDLSHFHDAGVARKLDQAVLALIEAYDPKGLAAALAAHRAEACGGGPVAAVMLAAQELGATRAVVLQYANSGDVTGDRSNVVGYAAAALLRN